MKVNVNLQNTKIFEELVLAINTILNDDRVDEKVRNEYKKRLNQHLNI